MARCCICDRAIERDDAPVLSMGAVGNARLLCDECAALLDTATLGENIDEITSAMDKVGKIMADHDPDGVTLETVSEIMLAAGERAKAIKDGSYDFSLDESDADNGGLDDIPEDMLESEEDKEKDKIDEEKNKEFEKIYNGFLIGAIIAAVLFVVWKVLEAFGVDFSKFFEF